MRDLKLFSLFTLILLACLTSVAGTSALLFLSPSNGTNYTAPAAVTFAWDTANVSFNLSGQAIQNVSGTNVTVSSLPIGAYLASIVSQSDPNATANLTFTVAAALANNTNATNNTNTTVNSTNTTNPTNGTNSTNITQPLPQNITLTTDGALYEAGTSARIRIAVTRPEQLALSITRNQVVIDTYTVNVQQQTDFLYALSGIGSYLATATGATASGAAAFTVQNSTVGVTISGSSVASSGRVTSFMAQATGGTQPYTYLWIFSDNTTSTGVTADHVFATAGNYTATVLVQDSTSRSATSNMSISVTDQVFSIYVTVLGNGNRLIPNASVSLGSTANGGTGRSGVTDAFGSVGFTGLGAGNYTVNMTYNGLTNGLANIVGGNKTWNDSRVVNLIADSSVTIITAIPDIRDPNVISISNPGSNATNSTNATNSSSSSNTTSPISAAVSASNSAAAAAAAASQFGNVGGSAGRPLTASQAEAQQVLEQSRSDALAEIRSTQASFVRSADKSEILAILKLDTDFSQAEKTVTSATSAQEISKAMESVPKDILVLAKDTTILRRDVGEAQEDIAHAITILAKDKTESAKYKYSIESAIANTSITSKRTVVRVTRDNPSASSEVYTIFSRSATGARDVSFLEFVPKSIASDASKLHVQGGHDVLESDPVIQFLTTDYTYYVQGEVTGEPTVLPLPATLTEPPSLLGYVAVKLNLSSTDHGGLYLIILGVLIASIIIGNLYLRSQTNSSLPAFNELAELAMSACEQQGPGAAARYVNELTAIHASLPTKEQAETSSIVTYFKEATSRYEFQASAAHLRNVLALGDQKAIATAYERVMQHYDSLSENARVLEQSSFNRINAEIDAHVTSHELKPTPEVVPKPITTLVEEPAEASLGSEEPGAHQW